MVQAAQHLPVGGGGLSDFYNYYHLGDHLGDHLGEHLGEHHGDPRLQVTLHWQHFTTRPSRVQYSGLQEIYLGFDFIGQAPTPITG